MEHQLFKTGTTTVGIVAKDGIILAADKKMTLGGQIVSSKKMEKVLLLNEEMALTVAGNVSDIQLLVKLIKAQVKLEELRKGKKVKVKEAANLLANLVYNNIRKMSMIPGITGFLFGGKDNEGFHLFQLGYDGSVTKYDDYVTDGSGMMFATGVLEAGYVKDVSMDEAVKLATKAVSAAMERDTGSGGGIDIVSITKEGARKIMTKQLESKLA
ncbi:MAG TPA: proteasome subunit beta [Candidatus Nanoarchaeia archaeon]|nr:proteasome subunit beta [Candidatus Nanoarchaeia archaeon]